MFGSHWREPGFWKWWWQHRVPFEFRAGAYLLLLMLLLGGGLFAADRLSSANAGSGTGAYVLETTVARTVTIREHGKLVRKLLPVVRRIYVRPSTRYRTETEVGTQLITSPGQVRLVRQRVVRYVPTVRNRVLTVSGKTQTLSEPRLVPVTTVETRTRTNVVTAARTLTDTQVRTAVVTNQQTVVDQRTVTNNQTQTRTLTETLPPRTVTETLPPRTVTETLPSVTVTQTQTLPPETVTTIVTVTVPKPH